MALERLRGPPLGIPPPSAGPSECPSLESPEIFRKGALRIEGRKFSGEIFFRN